MFPPPVSRRPLSRLAAAASSLQVRLVLAVVTALAVGIVLVTYFAVRQAGRDTLALQRQRELASAVHTADMLSHRVIELQRGLHATARQLDRGSVDDLDKLEAVIASQPVLRVMFWDLDIFSGDGHMRLYVGVDGVRRPNLDLHERAYFKDTVRERRSIVSDPVKSKLVKSPVILFTEPLEDATGLYGVLAGTLQLSQRGLIDDLVEAPGINNVGATVIVTDAHGVIIAAPSPDQLMRSIADEPQFSQAFKQWKIDGSAAEPSGLSLAQPGQVVSVAGVAGPEWVVWRVLPEATLLQPLEGAKRSALLVASVLIAALSLAAWWLLSRQLRPLEQLQDRARHLFDGMFRLDEGWPEVHGEIGALSHTLRHVATERAQLEAVNQLMMKKLESVMTAAPVGIAFTRDFRFELVSTEFCRLFGMPEEDLLGRNPRILHATPEDDHRLNVACGAAFDAGEGYVGEWRLKHADGTLFWARLRGKPVDASNPRSGTIWTVYDIDEQVAQREQLEWSAHHDALTGLRNRHAFEQSLGRVFDARPRSEPAAVVMIDLDHFKPVNDIAGHAGGDAVLKAVAHAISAAVRASDLVARVGGDEFALLLERCPIDVAQRIAEDVRRAVHAVAVHWGGKQLQVGACLGVAPLSNDLPDVAAWVAAADAACYVAKNSGRGGVRLAARLGDDEPQDSQLDDASL